MNEMYMETKISPCDHLRKNTRHLKEVDGPVLNTMYYFSTLGNAFFRKTIHTFGSRKRNLCRTQI